MSNLNFSDFNFSERHTATISEQPIVAVVYTFNLYQTEQPATEAIQTSKERKRRRRKDKKIAGGRDQDHQAGFQRHLWSISFGWCVNTQPLSFVLFIGQSSHMHNLLFSNFSEVDWRSLLFSIPLPLSETCCLKLGFRDSYPG